ncbi:MAG: ABC transporter permease [Alphaproteobacteria bacterium]
MSLVLSIAVSHLRFRRRQTLVSVLGAALGVGFFIGIAAMMQGFQRDFVARVIDVQPHIVIRDEFRHPPPQPVEMVFPGGAVQLVGVKPKDEVRGIRNARAVIDSLRRLPGLHVAPVLSGQVLLRFGAKDVATSVTGIEPEQERLVTNLEKDMVEGSLDALRTSPNAIILGQGVAEKAGVRLNDTVSAVSPEGVALKMTVVGIFASGITLVDNFDSYALLKKVQILQNRPNVVNRIRIKLDDIADASTMARRIEARFGYRAESWEEASRNVLGIFIIQNAIMYSTVGAILIVASFGIFNIISTVVFEKTRDIAILKSMGFTEADIRRIFVLEGLAIGMIGTLVGWLIGYGLVELMASIDIKMEGFVKAQGFILYRTPKHYLISGGVAVVTATFAAWLPARRAARLRPVEILRGGG